MQKFNGRISRITIYLLYIMYYCTPYALCKLLYNIDKSALPDIYTHDTLVHVELKGKYMCKLYFWTSYISAYICVFVQHKAVCIK